MASQIRTVRFFCRPDNKEALKWEQKIRVWLRKNYPRIKIVDKKPQALLVLGGDGTILEAARRFHKSGTIVFGLNLGKIGFLASAREPEKFLSALNKFLSGDYLIAKRMMLSATVFRNNRAIFKVDSLNDLAVQNLLGMVEIEVSVEGFPFQNIHGTGILVATATGSTAYNLSAHGPIIMPDIKCIILTELMDHNIPTPSIVVKRNKYISIKVLNFRERGLLSISGSNKKADVLLISDGETIFPLEEKDVIKIKRSLRLVKFAEIEENYFFKSLQEKFSFR